MLLQYGILAFHGQISRPKTTDGTTGRINDSVHETDDDDDEWIRQSLNELLFPTKCHREPESFLFLIAALLAHSSPIDLSP